MSKKRTINRRMFLRGAGGFSLAIPFLPSLMPRSAWAQSSVAPKRYFTFVGDYDYGHQMHWFPTLNPLTNTYNSANGDHSIGYQRLSSFIPNSNDELSYILGNGLNPYANKMNVLRGLNFHTRIGHGRGPGLGNMQAQDNHDTQVGSLQPLPTIDRVLAANRNFTPYDRDPLHVGTSSWGSYSYLRDQNGNIVRATPRTSKPHELFEQLFNPGGTPLAEGGSGGGNTNSRPTLDVLSRVMEDYRRVVNGRNISSTDRNVLNNAMDRISSLQNALQGNNSNNTAGCSYSNIDVAQSRTDGMSTDNYSAIDHGYAYRMYAQIFAAAASCDLHRVFNFHVNNLPGLYDRHPTEDFHQGHSHRPFEVVSSNGNQVNHLWMATIWRNYIRNFLVPLVEALDSSPDINSMSLLDNSLVHMTLENSTSHNDNSRPCLLIGGAGGSLTTGHMIDYSRRTVMGTRNGQPYNLNLEHPQGDNFSSDPNSSTFGHCYYGAHYNRVLTTILRSMGLQPSEYENPNINSFFRNRSDSLIGAQNNNIQSVGGYGHIGTQNSGVWYYTNEQLYDRQYSRYNYNFYKDILPFPPSSAS